MELVALHMSKQESHLEARIALCIRIVNQEATSLNKQACAPAVDLQEGPLPGGRALYVPHFNPVTEDLEPTYLMKAGDKEVSQL